MSNLKEIVASLCEGDKVRVTFRKTRTRAGEYEYTVVGRAYRNHAGGGLWVGGTVVDSEETPVSVEILERAKQPFYTNTDREPELGDVAGAEDIQGRMVCLGDYWTHERRGDYGDLRYTTIPMFDMTPGRLTLLAETYEVKS